MAGIKENYGSHHEIRILVQVIGPLPFHPAQDSALIKPKILLNTWLHQLKSKDQFPTVSIRRGGRRRSCRLYYFMEGSFTSECLLFRLSES
ncbi:uncharacterized protein LOC111465735 isoform X2 [Cucurbita maxima]|uniref:Uncharacterized protein LOC111465735 isoform X2 n=1 Tax=Cucurbita maxima TaxID=3661 RepID=A0A6J1HSI4_CUCMA|nr:uncharacterized protein LOC111465735 isoform X2 [Cucurbita maxima]